MKTIFQKLSIVALVVLSFSCADYTDDITKVNLPDVPIVFTGAFTSGFNPYYTVPYAGGNGTIAITLEIPADNSHTIKSVDRIIAGTTAINAGNVAATTPANYLTVPINATGKSVTINTTIAEFNLKVPTAAIPATSAGASAASPPTFNVPYHERAFMFRLTLDDNTTVVPMQVRIRVTY